MNTKADLFAGGVMAGLFLLTSAALSWVTGEWTPLIGCLIALGIAAVVMVVTIAMCILGGEAVPLG